MQTILEELHILLKIVILVLSLNSKKAMRNTKVSSNREVASFEEYIKHFAET